MPAICRIRPTFSFFGQHSKNTWFPPHITQTCAAVDVSAPPPLVVLVVARLGGLLPPPVVEVRTGGALADGGFVLNLFGSCLKWHDSPFGQVFPEVQCQQSARLSARGGELYCCGCGCCAVCMRVCWWGCARVGAYVPSAFRCLRLHWSPY